MVNVLYREHQALLAHLLEKRVDFILIGGYAVILYGYERTTGDMDLWVRPDNANKLLLIEALRELDFEEADLSFIETQNFEEHYTFCIGEAPLKVDFITRISGVTYEEARPQVVMAEADGIMLPILHINHLVRSKIANGRLKDMADIEELQRIQAAKNKSL